MKMKLMDVLVKAQQMDAMATKALPIRLSYAIERNRETLMKEYARYEEQRRKMCEMFAEKDAEGKPITEDGHYKLTDENMQELTKSLDEFRETTEIEVEIYKYTKPIEDLLTELDGNSKFDTLTANDLRVLSFIIDE